MSEDFKKRILKLEIFGDNLKRAQDLDVSKIGISGSHLKFFSKTGEEIKQSATVSIGYDGNTKFKHDMQIHSVDTQLLMEPAHFLFDFNEVYFIDTNTKEGISVSVICKNMSIKLKKGQFIEKGKIPVLCTLNLVMRQRKGQSVNWSNPFRKERADFLRDTGSRLSMILR